MSDWTTLPMAKKHAGIPLEDCSQDDLLSSFLERAEAMVIDYVVNYLTDDEPVAPDSNTTGVDLRVAQQLQGAMYLQFVELWRFRGDDVDGDLPESRVPGALSPAVERAILKFRLPSIG